ncbi:MAG: hypothetical protein GY821_17810 [Gammaproteobacteria bacterium]|nr:hypothetical protein [Gammaproteobacteria bacterium]
MKHIVEFLFSIGLFINALLFVPQFLKIWRRKTANDISLTTFVGFWFIQLSIVAHGLIHHDLILSIGYLISMLTCGSVIVSAIYFRMKQDKNT